MIYIITHKPVRLPKMPGYQPLQVGLAEEEFPGCVRDNTGQNISGRNPSFCELTGLYWIWKNTGDPIKGLVHYRRVFGRRPLTGGISQCFTYAELEGMLTGWDALVPKKAWYHVNARDQLLMESCSRETFDALEETVRALCPDYMDSFHRFFSRNGAWQYNMLVARAEVYDAYCRWLFELLFHLEPKLDIGAMNAYQRRVFGFLGERLLNVWLIHNGLKVRELPVIQTEATLAERLIYERRNLTNRVRFAIRY